MITVLTNTSKAMVGTKIVEESFHVLLLCFLVAAEVLCGQPSGDIITLIQEMKSELNDVKHHVEKQESRDNATQKILLMVLEQNIRMKSSLAKLAEGVKDTRKFEKKVETISKDLDRLKKEVNDAKRISPYIHEIKTDVVILKSILTSPVPGKTWENPSESCDWLNKRFFRMKSGKYWIKVDGQPKYQHCSMIEAGIPPLRCSSHPCHPDAACEDTSISVKCTCYCGYVGDGKQCKKYFAPVKNSNGSLLITKECATRANNLLTTFKVVRKEYRVTFELFFNKMGSSVYNILHFTTGGDCCNIGQRIPSVSVHRQNMLHICSAVNKSGNTKTSTGIPLNQWSKAEIKQVVNDKHQHIYSVTVNGEVVYKEVNNKPREFKNVKFYMSDPFYPTERGYIRNLFVQGYE